MMPEEAKTGVMDLMKRTLDLLRLADEMATAAKPCTAGGRSVHATERQALRRARSRYQTARAELKALVEAAP